MSRPLPSRISTVDLNSVDCDDEIVRRYNAYPVLLQALNNIVADADQSNGGRLRRLPIVVNLKEQAEKAIKLAEGEL